MGEEAAYYENHNNEGRPSTRKKGRLHTSSRKKAVAKKEENASGSDAFREGRKGRVSPSKLLREKTRRLSFAREKGAREEGCPPFHL